MSLTGTLLTFSWQSNPVIRDVFSLAPAALAEINTPMFPPAKRFPKRCKVPGCSSVYRCTVSLLTRRKAGPTEMKQKKSRFLTAATSKRERDAKNKTSPSPRRCTACLSLALHCTKFSLPDVFPIAGFLEVKLQCFSLALVYRAKCLPNAQGKALFFLGLQFPAHTSGFLCSTHTNQRNPPVSEAFGCCWTPSSHCRAGTSHEGLLGWSCQMAPYEAGRLETELGSSQHPAVTGRFRLLLGWHFPSMSCALRVTQPPGCGPHPAHTTAPTAASRTVLSIAGLRLQQQQLPTCSEGGQLPSQAATQRLF
ncbi:uncharacterized protein LOC121076251 [Cygnus olor]|uniref:uncharacterized protein LOC121076251 n=1 Tax=Cygnus olor TaxID=8869 RepID=UPI001ADEA880|nr:uncharacterized protein LOC121076251 [Cygnus olor]